MQKMLRSLALAGAMLGLVLPAAQLAPAHADQSSIVTPGSPLPMTSLKSFLDGGFKATVGCWSGTAAPSATGTPVNYQHWCDTSGGTTVVEKQYDSASWDSLWSVNTSTHAVTWLGALGSINGLTGLVVGNGASAPSAYAGVSCTNQFLRALSASGASTCNTVQNTDLANSSVTLSAGTSFGITAPGAMSLGTSYTIGATTDNLHFADLGLGAAAPTSGGQIASVLGANNITGIQVKRATDTSPTGKFIDFQTTTGTSLFNVDVNGIVSAPEIIMPAGTSGSLTLLPAAISGSSSIRFPNGVTDFSATGGTGQYLKQASSGGAFTVGTIAAADLPGSFSGFANPSATVCNAAVNGSAATALHSDGAPGVSTSCQLQLASLGLNVAAPSTAGLYSATLGANNVTGLTIKRNTDTSPTGSFAAFLSAASATLWGVDITGIQTSTGLVVTPTASSLNKGLNITQTADGSVGGGATQTMNLVTISSDDVANATGATYGFRVNHSFGTSTAAGSRTALGGTLNLTAATNAGSTANSRYYVATYGTVNVNSPDNGSGGTPLGKFVGVAGSANSISGATNLFEMVGVQSAIVVATGSSLANRYGFLAEDESNVAGSSDDAAYALTGISGAVGFKNAFLLTAVDGQAPLISTGCIVCTSGSATIAKGWDSTSYTISGNAWASTGATIDGSGNVNVASANTYSWNSDAYLGRVAAGNIRHGAADAASPVAQTYSVQNVATGTSNTAGANTIFAGSRGTGTGNGGNIAMQVALPGTTGSSQNSLVSRATILGSTGYIGLGTETNPQSMLTVSNNVTTGINLGFNEPNQVTLIGADSNAMALAVVGFGNAGEMIGYRSNGSAGSKTAVGQNQVVFSFFSGGWNGTTWITSAGINFVSTEPAGPGWTNTANGTAIDLNIVKNGTQGTARAMRLQQSTGVSIASSTDGGAGTLFIVGQAFSALTSCSSTIKGTMAHITDSTTTAYGATITGGGSSDIYGRCNGANWTVMGS